MVSWPHSKNSFFSSSAHRRRWIEWRTLKTRRRKILDRNRKVKYWFVAERWTLFFYSSKAQIFYQMKISPITLSLPSFFCFVQPRQQAEKDEEKKILVYFHSKKRKRNRNRTRKKTHTHTAECYRCSMYRFSSYLSFFFLSLLK